MAFLDWLVIGIFALALIGVIVWVMKQKQNNAADYFLGGKDAGWIGSIVGHGDGPLGDPRLDDTSPRLGFRTFLHSLNGLYHA